MVEAGSEAVHRLASEAQVVAASRLLHVETRALLARRFADGTLSATDLAEARSNFDGWLRRLYVIEIDASLADEAGQLAERRLLRGMDAIHLASAALIARTGGELTFATYDDRLRRAAVAEKMEVLPS